MALGCRPSDAMEMARCRLGAGTETLNLFLVPRDSDRLTSDQLCRIICEPLQSEFSTRVFELSLPTVDLPAEEMRFICIAIDSSRPEKVKDIIKERLWAEQGDEHIPVAVEDVLCGRCRKKTPEFRLENYGFFIPFRARTPTDVRTHSFHHTPTFYRYRLAERRVGSLSEPLRDYLRSLFMSCPNHLFNQGGLRASAVRQGQLDLEIPVEQVRRHELVDLARQSRDYEKVKSRHENVQKFLLERDSYTVASEVPVWIEPWELEGYRDILKTDRTLTGHIDVLRHERDHSIGIWDYKPRATDERCADVQIFLYALMLSLRTGLPLTAFVCGYFDEEDAYMLRPSEVRLGHGS